MSRLVTDFLSLLAKKKIIQQSGDERETVFFKFQRLSILVQRFNSVLLHDFFICDDCPE